MPRNHRHSRNCSTTWFDLRRLVENNTIKILNVAGSRQSKEPGLDDWVMQELENALFR